ncbi:uncharacterized protein [Physcomitrium patens]|uniref:uncharacterized protein isoform X2 n=1 Tax=Physcomitrium patens TaxID=3218 RepID=UPI000D170AF2|nr:uncharacterized protein LOC112294315 isoform X2 [Physcomitrium patens]|eukprot:XP_024400380.1 uncharacterized protein LOC112294315 isoform X2 [Physcomitrella patens]
MDSGIPIRAKCFDFVLWRSFAREIWNESRRDSDSTEVGFIVRPYLDDFKERLTLEKCAVLVNYKYPVLGTFPST